VVSWLTPVGRLYSADLQGDVQDANPPYCLPDEPATRELQWPHHEQTPYSYYAAAASV